MHVITSLRHIGAHDFMCAGMHMQPAATEAAWHSKHSQKGGAPQGASASLR